MKKITKKVIISFSVLIAFLLLFGKMLYIYIYIYIGVLFFWFIQRRIYDE